MLVTGASVVTQNRPMRVTSKPANEKARDIDSDGSPYRLLRYEQCLERSEETTSFGTREARMALAAHRAGSRLWSECHGQLAGRGYRSWFSPRLPDREALCSQAAWSNVARSRGDHLYRRRRRGPGRLRVRSDGA